MTSYLYRDADGDLLYQKTRHVPKRFTFERPDPDAPGQWLSGLDGVSQTLFRLPELIASNGDQWVFCCEGERDVLSLTQLGLVATTAGSVGSWTPEYGSSGYFLGKRVCVLPDNDDAGRRLAETVAADISDEAAEVKVPELPGLPAGGDVSDWLGPDGQLDGKTEDEIRGALLALVEATPTWTPQAPVGLSARSASIISPAVVNLADVIAEHIDWLWPSRLAIGKVNLLAGDPNLGKTLISLDIAARVSRGDRFPDSEERTQVGGVILLSAEDGLADTVRPRLDAAGADVRKIAALTGVNIVGTNPGTIEEVWLNLKTDLAQVETVVQEMGDCRLIIIDPLSAYLGKTDSHKEAEVRGLIGPLAAMASRLRVAILAIAHLRKGQGSPMQRVMGSTGFIAAARSGHVVATDKADPTGQNRLFLNMKSNLAAEQPGLSYRVDVSLSPQPSIAWGAEPVYISAEEALAPAPSSPGPEPTDRLEAEEWLKLYLAQGPRPAKELIRDAKDVGIPERTLRRAKRELGVISGKEAFDKPWHWKLPVDPPKTKDANETP